MSNVFTLDSLREEAEKEFAPVKIQLGNGKEVTLRNLLRLSQSHRVKVLDLVQKLSANEEDGVEAVDAVGKTAEGILKLVADDASALLKELDGDVIVALRLVETWLGASQLGEAQSSPA